MFTFFISSVFIAVLDNELQSLACHFLPIRDKRKTHSRFHAVSLFKELAMGRLSGKERGMGD